MITSNGKEEKLKDTHSVFSDSAVGTSIISTKESESQPFEVNLAVTDNGKPLHAWI